MSTEEKKSAKKKLQASSTSNVPEGFSVWLLGLYDVSKMTEEELQEMYDSFKYQGFDRTQVLQQLYQAIPDQKIAAQAVLVCALRGPQKAAKVKLSTGRSLEMMGISASGGKGATKLTCQKITAATADLAAYFFRKLNVPKRLQVELPGWLQFPSAGSIKLPENLRSQHIAFAKSFSTQIGGVFNQQIYDQMVMNAYLDEGLKLF